MSDACEKEQVLKKEEKKMTILILVVQDENKEMETGNQPSSASSKDSKIYPNQWLYTINIWYNWIFYKLNKFIPLILQINPIDSQVNVYIYI